MSATPPAISQWRQSFLIENGVFQAPRTKAISIIAPDTPEELLEPPDRDDLGAQRLALGVPAFRGIRTRDYSYVEYITGEKELYDLRNDPYQLQNLASKADSALLAELSKRLHELMTCKASACQTMENAAFGVAK